MHSWKSCRSLGVVSSEGLCILYTKQEGGEMYVHWKTKKHDFQALIFSS